MLPFLLLVVLAVLPLFDLGPPPPAFEPGEVDPFRLALSLHMGLPGIFFSDHPMAIVLIMMGVAICSPISALVALLGGMMYGLAGLALQAKPDEIYLGLYGYNAVLSAVAIGGVFYAPTRLSITLAAVCAFLASALSFLLSPLFGAIKLPVLSIPFAFITIGCIMIVGKTLPSLVPVALHTVASPEEHRQRFLFAKSIISNCRRRLQLAMMGKKHNLFFEQADSKEKGDLRYIFKAIDQDGDEQISIRELEGQMNQVDQSFSDSEITRLFKNMDSDRNGLIDFEEFGELMLRHRTLMSRHDELVTYFLPIDANKDDLISADEMNIAMASVGEPPLTDEEISFVRERTTGQPLTWNQFIDVLLVT
jgi:Ca2+-binding EF-hand superfamily protein